jgi:hypothetical protein
MGRIESTAKTYSYWAAHSKGQMSVMNKELRGEGSTGLPQAYA